MSLLLALQSPSVSGTLAATEQSDSFSATGDIRVTGSLVTTESSDVFATTGDIRVTGSLVTTESSDVFAATGDIRVSGSLAASESSDTFAATGDIRVSGSLATTESSDVFVATGDVRVSGSLSPVEPSDVFSATGSISVSGSLSILEDTDTFSAIGLTEVTGLLSASEDSDIFSSTGSISEQQGKSHTWWQSSQDVWEFDRKRLAQLNARLARELSEEPTPPEPKLETPLVINEPVIEDLSVKVPIKKKVAPVEEAVKKVIYRPDFTVIMELQYEISILEMKLRTAEIQRTEDNDLEAFAIFLLSAID